MSQTYIDVTKEQVSGLVEQIQSHNPDRTVCLSKYTKVQVLAPTTKRKTHKFKFEIEIPSDAILGEQVISDFGGLALIDIATNRINPKYLTQD